MVTMFVVEGDGDHPQRRRRSPLPQLLLLSGVGAAEQLRPLGHRDGPRPARRRAQYEKPPVGVHRVPLATRPPPGSRTRRATRWGCGSPPKGSTLSATTSRSSPRRRIRRAGKRPTSASDAGWNTPTARALLTLASADVSVQPDLDFRFLTDPQGHGPVPGRRAPHRGDLRASGFQRPAGGAPVAHR